MPSIGAVTCTFVRGTAPVLKQRAAVWQVPGINGYGIHLLGTGDSSFRFVAVLFDTSANVNAWAVALQALQGQIVSITNDWANTYIRCFIARVSPPEKRAASGAGGARGEVSIEGIIV